MSVEEMTPSDKAKLLTAISEILTVNKAIGTYRKLEDKCISKSELIIDSIK